MDLEIKAGEYIGQFALQHIASNMTITPLSMTETTVSESSGKFGEAPIQRPGTAIAYYSSNDVTPKLQKVTLDVPYAILRSEMKAAAHRGDIDVPVDNDRLKSMRSTATAPVAADHPAGRMLSHGLTSPH